MKNFFQKPYRFAIVFSALLIGSFTFVMLDTFVIPKSYKVIVTQAADQTQSGASASQTQSQNAGQGSTQIADQATTEGNTQTASQPAAEAASDAVISDNSYQDDNISISIEKLREYDTDIYVADIQLSDASLLKTALAENTYGRNIKETTSAIAKENNAIFAINGDYYGFRDYGYVLRNGVLYRNTAGDSDALVIDNKGDFSTIAESQVSLDSLDLKSIWQILSFGPALLKDGQIVVDNNSEVSQHMSSNPRTAIGQISPLHYIVVVSDGRTSDNAGLSLVDLAQVFADKGCKNAYNLDGGGSSTMYFNGELINNPTDGRKFGEREVSDIVYIGY